MDAKEVYEEMKEEIAVTLSKNIMSVLILLLAKIDGADVSQSQIGQVRKIVQDDQLFAQLVVYSFLTPLPVEEVRLVDALFAKDYGKILQAAAECHILWESTHDGGTA